MPLDAFHPALQEWFRGAFAAPTAAQAAAWPAIARGEHVLVAAPTGSGKTLAAFLASIDGLVRESLAAPLPEETRIVYVSPLKALGNDVERNLVAPLEGIAACLRARGAPDPGIRTMVRTGDTPAAARETMRRHPPHIVVTTPESLYLLLTSDGGRRMLSTARTLIVDEIHALCANKRGAHLAISLERLAALTPAPPVRIGLSATQHPIGEVARFLTGCGEGGAPPACTIVDTGRTRELDLTLEVPGSPLEAVMSGEVWEEVFDRLAALGETHRTTLVFVNTRRMAERVARHLSERLGEDHVASHHGSLSRERRFDAEQRLKAGRLRALVATASLELGIDIGDVELVCQLGSPRSIGAFLQRAGRANHSVGGVPRGRLFPLSRDDLVECSALLDAIRRGELDWLSIPERPLDVLAQQIVAMAGCEEWDEPEMLALVRRAWPYRALDAARFTAITRMLSEGFATRRGRRGALLHRDAVHRRLRARRGARLTALTSGGAIPDNADFDVVLEPGGTFLGTINEDFAIESMPGDVFQLGNASWRILRVETGKVRVEDAQGLPPSLPFWLGEAPGRSDALSASAGRLRARVTRALAEGAGAGPDGARAAREAAAAILAAEIRLPQAAAEQLVDYLAAAHAVLGALPDCDTVVFERFFDESGGMQLVIHSTFGSRVNRAWGLALRKRFCRTFNFELQAAATEDAIVLSLGETHSFPLAEVARYLSPATAREVLVQALLDAPVFDVRWRWNANVSLAVPRSRGGKKVPPAIQRMQAEDLVAVVFPDQIACRENLAGPREIPDHPLVEQTIADALGEAMDADGLDHLLGRLTRGELRTVSVEPAEPSPLAAEILNARPYAFLDDAPLEERRARAVAARRSLDPESAADLGRLDPRAIEKVRAEAWPDPRDADELHDALTTLGFLSPSEAAGPRRPLFEDLAATGRACRFHTGEGEGAGVLMSATERLPELAAIFPRGYAEPAVTVPAEFRERRWSREEALTEVLRARLSGLGPVSAARLAVDLGIPSSDVEVALLRLESEGYVLRGRFTGADAGLEWCERRLLARIHRYTLSRLRREIRPVERADFLRYLIEWHRMRESDRPSGAAALVEVIRRLAGFAAPASAWESELLPARLADYAPELLDGLCLAGRVVWMRAGARAGGEPALASPIRSTTITLMLREQAGRWPSAAAPETDAATLPEGPARAVAALRAKGALFFDELAHETAMNRFDLTRALGRLVVGGVVRADGFAGLRALLAGGGSRPGRGRRLHHRADLDSAGRWVLCPPAPAAPPSEDAMDALVLGLLSRYGIVFRALLAREAALPPWRGLLRALRRLEGRGDLRGGRFVAGFSGEQFALPESIPLLREVRRRRPGGELVAVAAADPLNLVGILTPGERIAATARARIALRDGVPAGVLHGDEIHLLAPMDGAAAFDVRAALLSRRIPGRPPAAYPRPLAAGG